MPEPLPPLTAPQPIKPKPPTSLWGTLGDVGQTLFQYQLPGSSQKRSFLDLWPWSLPAPSAAPPPQGPPAKQGPTTQGGPEKQGGSTSKSINDWLAENGFAGDSAGVESAAQTEERLAHARLYNAEADKYNRALTSGDWREAIRSRNAVRELANQRTMMDFRHDMANMVQAAFSSPAMLSLFTQQLPALIGALGGAPQVPLESLSGITGKQLPGFEGPGSTRAVGGLPGGMYGLSSIGSPLLNRASLAQPIGETSQAQAGQFDLAQRQLQAAQGFGEQPTQQSGSEQMGESSGLDINKLQAVLGPLGQLQDVLGMEQRPGARRAPSLSRR